MASDGNKRNVPIRVARRLPIYYRFLRELMENGVERISSAELGARIGVTASQLRQDLSHFGSFGQQGYGYRVDDLYREISDILGLHQRYKMVLIGSGNLGRAIANYEGFRRRGFQVVAAFDADPDVIGTRVGVLEVQPIDQLEEYLRRIKIHIGVLTVPAHGAQKVVDTLVRCGVKGIWSFAPVRIQVPSDVAVEHIHLSDSLLSLAFRMRQAAIQAEEDEFEDA
jgi:redox-sensing transcriptional repressor